MKMNDDDVYDDYNTNNNNDHYEGYIYWFSWLK